MDYVLWYNRCKVSDCSLAKRLSDAAESVDLVRFVAWYSDDDEVIRYDRCTCACDRCNGELSLVLLRCSERTLETALDAEPVLVERRRHTERCVGNVFVHYSFAHPPILDSDTLERILSFAEVRFLYVATALDTTTGAEDASVFKINLVKRKSPGCYRDVDWMAGRIRAATSCTAKPFEIRYVTYLSPFAEQKSHCATVRPAALGSLRSLRPKKKRRLR